MNTDEKKMEKEEMQNILAGNEENGKARGTPGKHPGGNCAFAPGSCCRKTDCGPTGSNG